MSWAIRIDRISKLYPLAGPAPVGTNLREELGRAVRSALRFGRARGRSADAPGAAPGATLPSDALEDAPDRHFWALRDLTIDISPGDVVGVLGRNGAGKSTLLKILSRITPPTHGEIRYRGRMVSLLEVGTGFHRELTGRENVYLNGTILGMRRAEITRKLDEIVEFSEVGAFLDMPVKYYSSGMYVRLAFSVAAHLETDILVVDEVLAVGDAQFQRKCLGKMREMSGSQGRTVLFVSHQMNAVRRLCNRGLYLRRGRTIGLESMDASVERYLAIEGGGVPDADLSGAPRGDDLGTVVQVRRVRVADGAELAYGRDARFVFTVACRRPLGEVVLGLGFDNADGTRVLTVDSDNSGATLDFEAGVHEVEVEVPRFPLHPTVYTCSAGVLAGRRLLDLVPAFGSWEVHSPPTDHVSQRGYAGSRPPVVVRRLGVRPATPVARVV